MAFLELSISVLASFGSGYAVLMALGEIIFVIVCFRVVLHTAKKE